MLLRVLWELVNARWKWCWKWFGKFQREVKSLEKTLAGPFGGKVFLINNQRLLGSWAEESPVINRRPAPLKPVEHFFD